MVIDPSRPQEEGRPARRCVCQDITSLEISDVSGRRPETLRFRLRANQLKSRFLQNQSSLLEQALVFSPSLQAFPRFDYFEGTVSDGVGESPGFGLCDRECE